MLIATFGPSTGWVGKTIVFENGTFFLQDHGLVSATDVMTYGQQGHLIWANQGMRAWVGARVQAPHAVTPASTPRSAAVAGSPLVRADDGRTSGLVAASMIGLALVILGLFGAIYFFAFFDTSVAVPTTDLGNGMTVGGGRVNNFGLMDDRRNGILFGFGAAAAGGVLMYVGRKRSLVPPTLSTATDVSTGAGKAAATCAACRGPVQVGAAYCPHCGKALSWAAVAQPL